jgi:FkbM family methyltransferase
MIDFYRQFIAPNDLVFDVGANIGERAEVFSELALQVLAVEPVYDSLLALERRVAHCANVITLGRAVGAAEGTGNIHTSRAAPTIGTASLSDDWIDAVKKSKRFGDADKWDKSHPVVITTLDALIKEYGRPAFIKIDVEGYEQEVLIGLTQPVKALSFEFTPETTQRAHHCIFQCKELGMDEFNLSLGHTFELGEWTDARGIIPRLYNHRFSTTIYGDIYARLPK